MADLGSGPGMLSIGAAILGSEHVVGFELDVDAIEIARATCEEMEVEVDFVLCDVVKLDEQVGQVMYF